MARQADAAVHAQYGETSVLATVVAEKTARPGIDFFPLTVNYQERTYSAGKIPGGYFKREGRPTEKETLTSRLIDRPIRPLFIEGFKHETQVVVTVLSHDMENDPDIVGMVAASAALTLSGLPFLGPIAAARVGVVNGQFVLNPMIDEMAESALDLVVAGTGDAVMMVESEAKELPEQQMLEAVMFGHRGFQPVIQAIIKLAEKAAKEPWDFQPPDKSKYGEKAKALVEAELRTAFATPEKQKRHELVEAASAKVKKELLAADADAERAGAARLRVQGVGAGCGARRHHPLRQAHRRARSRDRAADHIRGARAAPRARLRPLHPRRDAGAGRRHPRHRRGRAIRRCARRHAQGAVPAALQLPTLLGRRDGPHERARPARDRSRQARLAGAAPADAEPGGVPLHGACRLRDHRIQRLLVDGLGVRRLAGADGRRRAAEAPRRRHRHGPHQGGQQLRRALRHSGRRGPPGRHGLQGGRHGEGRHLAADGHQDRRHHRGDHAPGAGAGQRRSHAHPRRDGQGARQRPHRARRARAAHRDHQDPGRQDPRGDRLGRLGDPRDRRRVGRQDRHRGRRHHQDRRRQARGDRGGALAHPRHHVRARGRPGLQGQGRQDHGVRRLRELLRRQGRPGAHLAAHPRPAADRAGGRQGGPGGVGQAAWASTTAARCASP